jgi:hypothetical protein
VGRLGLVGCVYGWSTVHDTASQLQALSHHTAGGHFDRVGFRVRDLSTGLEGGFVGFGWGVATPGYAGKTVHESPHPILILRVAWV